MEGCDSLDSEMADLEGIQCESPSAIDQDDEDEVEELRNSLREAVQDPSVKPKLQCLMVDPSFSMVTVQSEDSGIVWETASSRCSTPWASETSSISEGYSMDGSGTQGQITIVFDDEQIIRRRIRSGGRSSRLSDRLRRPGSSRSGSALGVERLEMVEVSVPNVKQEKTQGEPDLEEIKDKDQQLFSLISEGYEILNIRVPSKLPTVDEEESTDLQDNLSYLDKTPGIKSRKVSSQLMSQDLSEDVKVEIVENKEASEENSTDSGIGDSKIKRNSTGDMDYFEKFTLVDVVVPGKQAPESQQEVNVPAAKPQEDEVMPGQETSTDSPTASDESFVFVTDTEMAGDHLDQMFYGNGAQEASDDTPQGREEAEMKSGEKIRVRRASQRSQKDNGSVLFCSEQTVLTPIFISPGPPKIIDQILLDEPTAMSYMYSDLYEEAIGERTASEGECSEAEHVASEKIFIRRLSDSEEADGYLEMFTLRDETSMVEVQPEKDSVEDEDERVGRRMWSQSVFEMTGSLTRVKDEVKEKEQVMNEEERREEESAVKNDLESIKDKGEEENVVTQMKVVETEPSVVRDEKVSPIRTCPEEFTEMPEEKETIKETEVKQEVTKVQKVSSAAEVSSAMEIHADDEPESDRASAVPETSKNGTDQQVQQPTVDGLPPAELHREVVEETDQTAEELEYEIITKQEAREMPAPEEDVDEPLLQPEEEKIEMEKQDMEIRMEERELALPPGEEPIEAEYDIIDAEEESQARAAAELQGMNWFCLACGCLLSEEACASGEHQDHERTSVDRAYEDIKEKLSDWISELQARSENIEDLVSELELAYNSVEDQCAEIEESMQSQNEEMMALVMEQYNGMSLGMEEEKKAKLEQLYDQIVTSQENIDSAKGILETTAREAETEARVSWSTYQRCACVFRLKAALKSAMSLELGPKGLLVFENYTKGNNSSAHLKQRKGIAVPLKPTLQPQEPGSATSTSVTVYWNVNPGDIIDCFQVYCMEDPQGAVSEEYRVTVKESYCVLEELKPNKTYRVWVMAVNYSGCSLPSERLAFSTAPSVPVIDPKNCSVLWGSATLRWVSDHLSPGCSYTLEYCRQYELEGEGVRYISGIGGAEQKVILQPNENYLFNIKAVNEAGGSEQSEAALISTKGTRFRLLKASAHPLLELSEDLTTVCYGPSTHDNTQYPTILGELLPARGQYYWETVVTGCAAYRVGVAYETANRSRPLGQNSKSWCLQCTPTASSCGYRLLHNGVTSDVVVIDIPERVGTLMDYQHGQLSFYNALSGQLLGSLSHRFAQPCHPTLGLEQPGSLTISMALEVPAFATHS
ncbi:unnamed protein product [Lota lota]